ncbi:MAG TPA: L-threonylcarbamoyladenylate synthase [Bacteriovoracaceae bacterium]|nr:L-threonylcarbamoyladenylate synthase [Bacteriovoracaceae bacterium]
MKVDLKTAREKLLNGDVVAIPTETVYGLGGWIGSDEGLKKIFSTKERPFFDPLIVHIDSIASAKKLTSDWTVAHQAMAEACWPGPLTLIAKKNEQINPLITSGLDSVGLRCPRHPLTLELLAGIEGGIAAPSANKFGKTSPTTTNHVEEEFEGKVAILEGGPCEVGIESTVAGVIRTDRGFLIEIYRPGFFTAEKLSLILKEKGILAEVKYTESPVAPGQLKHHYMPNIPLVIVPESFDWEKDQKLIEAELLRNFKCPVRWIQSEDPRIASRELYEKMRAFESEGFDIILTSRPTSHFGEEWLGIWNRLEKAKTLAL